MAEPFLSEIRLMSFNFAPKGWTMCNGALLPINQNQALFSLLGTTYGGDGRVTFGLPNLQGRIPMHMGNGFTLGEVGGEQAHTLVVSELPAHTHQVVAVAATADQNVGGVSPGVTKALSQGIVSITSTQTTPANIYGTGSPNKALAQNAITNNGGSQPHVNMQPFLTLNFSIALQGIFPSQN